MEKHLNTIAGVVQLMASATSEEDWNAKADEVKAAYGGQYPSFWFTMIVVSGIAEKTQRNWRAKEA